MDGSFLRLGERHEIAIYLREGTPYLAEFRGGRAELHTVGTWFSLNDRRGALRRAGADPLPIPPEVAERIERLHRDAARSDRPAPDFVGWIVATTKETLCRSFASRS